MHKTNGRTVLIEMARSKGLLHKAGKHKGELNHNAVARELEVSQPTLTRFLNRTQGDPSPDWLVQAMVKHWGLTPDQAEGRPNPQLSLSVSPTAAIIAEHWDHLPEGLQSAMFDMIDRWLAFERRNPLLAKAVASPPVGDNYKLFEKKIELWQAQYRKKAQPS